MMRKMAKDLKQLELLIAGIVVELMLTRGTKMGQKQHFDITTTSQRDRF
jgi:hypothetical protein